MANALTPSTVTFSEAAIYLTRNVALKISEIFRLEDNDEISLYVFFFSRTLKKDRHPGKLHCTFFARIISKVIYIEGG